MRLFHTQARRDPWALSGPLAGISFIAGIGGSMARADSPYPRPWATPSEVRTYFTENAGAARLSATGQFISTICLARFTASVARLAGSGGLRTAAVAGGGVAKAAWFIPAARFPGLIVCAIAGVRLSRVTG